MCHSPLVWTLHVRCPADVRDRGGVEMNQHSRVWRCQSLYDFTSAFLARRRAPQEFNGLTGFCGTVGQHYCVAKAPSQTQRVAYRVF